MGESIGTVLATELVGPAVPGVLFLGLLCLLHTLSLLLLHMKCLLHSLLDLLLYVLHLLVKLVHLRPLLLHLHLQLPHGVQLRGVGTAGVLGPTCSGGLHSHGQAVHQGLGRVGGRGGVGVGGPVGAVLGTQEQRLHVVLGVQARGQGLRQGTLVAGEDRAVVVREAGAIVAAGTSGHRAATGRTGPSGRGSRCNETAGSVADRKRHTQMATQGQNSV